MAKKNNGARPLAESAIAMALAGIMWHVFAPMPGIGPYFKYMSASLIAIVGSRHGRHWSTMTAVGLNALVGLAYGPKELLDSLLLVTPIGLMLPTGGPDGDEAADDRREFGLLNTETDKSKAEASFRRHDTWSAGKWWAMILLSYALLYPARVWALATLMGAKVSDVVGSMAATSYHVFERFLGIGEYISRYSCRSGRGLDADYPACSRHGLWRNAVSGEPAGLLWGPRDPQTDPGRLTELS